MTCEIYGNPTLVLLEAISNTSLTKLLLQHKITFPIFWDIRETINLLGANDSLDYPELLLLSKSATTRLLSTIFPQKPQKVSINKYLKLILSGKLEEFLDSEPKDDCIVYLVYFKDIEVYKAGRTSRSVKVRFAGYPEYLNLLEVITSYTDSFSLEKLWLGKLSSLRDIEATFSFPFPGYTECFRLYPCTHTEIVNTILDAESTLNSFDQPLV